MNADNRPPPLPASRLDYAEPSRRAPLRLDWYAFASHLIGWAVLGVVLFVVLAWVVPRFEDVLKDFRVTLTAPTKALLTISRSRVLLLLLPPLAVAHAFAAAAWYPHSGRPGRFVYRLVLMLLLAAVVAYFFVALFVPYVTLMSGIGAGGGAGGSKR
jgi:hypothetical protein